MSSDDERRALLVSREVTGEAWAEVTTTSNFYATSGDTTRNALKRGRTYARETCARFVLRRRNRQWCVRFCVRWAGLQGLLPGVDQVYSGTKSDKSTAHCVRKLHRVKIEKKLDGSLPLASELHAREQY